MPVWLPSATAEALLTTPDEHALFLLQAWHELLDPQSPDSFKARVLDLNLLLEDIEHVVGVCGTDRRWGAHLPMLADELCLALASEQRVILPGCQVHRALTTVIADAKNEHVGTLKTAITVAKGLLGRPEHWLVADLNALVADDPKKKSTRIRRLSTLATHALYRGLSEECVRCITPQLATASAIDVASALIAPLGAKSRAYQCTIAVMGDANDLSSLIRAAGLRRITSAVLQNGDDTSKAWAIQTNGVFFVEQTFTAESEYSAAEGALSKVSEILNLQCLHANNALFKASPNVLVKSEEAIRSIAVTPSKHFGLRPRRKATSLTVDRYQHVGARISGRLSNALESHSLALGANDARTALTFLWTALEAIAGSSDGLPIGKRISSAISPLVAWRRLDKIVTYLAICVQQMLIWQGGGASKKYLVRSSFGRVSQDDVLAAIAGPKDNPIILYLLKVCSPAPLLTYRLFEAWKAFSSPKVLAGELSYSKQRIEWQIQRIYRARNLLVHRGEQSHLTWRLLQNAQYYVSIVLSRVLHDTAEHSTWGINESLAYQALQFNYVVGKLRNEDGKGLIHRDILGARSADPSAMPWSWLRP